MKFPLIFVYVLHLNMRPINDGCVCFLFLFFPAMLLGADTGNFFLNCGMSLTSFGALPYEYHKGRKASRLSRVFARE